MSKVESRREFQETQIMRTVSPGRGGRGSSQNLAEFDQNLDHLLEDLQSSVSRPGSSLGNKDTTKSITYESQSTTGRINPPNRVSNLKAANPMTEYSSDDSYTYTTPDGGTKSVKTFKKESYHTYSSDQVPEKIRMQNNINQLDSLLDDLQQVKHSGSYNNVGGDPGLQDNRHASKRTVQRELHYGGTPSRSSSGSRSRTLERSEREGSVTRELQYSSEGQYGDLKSIRTASPSPSRGDTLSRQTKVTNVHEYPLAVVETTTPDINPEILANLDPSLLPAGNTKVTTTIKTYTYEIPGNGTAVPAYGDSTLDRSYVYSPNTTQTTPSKSFVYNKVENNALISRNVNYTPPPPPSQDIHYTVKEITTTDSKKTYPPRSPQPGYHLIKEVTSSTNNMVEDHPPYQKPTGPGHDRTVVKETVTTRNYQPGYPHHPDTYPAGPGGQTFIYNETTTTRNVKDGYPPDRHPGDRYPPQGGGYPPSTPPGQTTYIIKETHNTTNTTNRNAGPPYTNGYPPRDTESFDPKYPPHGRSPREPVNVTYKYTSHTSSTNKVKGGYPPGPDTEPLLHPRPFPIDGEPEGPPKKLDDLMANIGPPPPNSPYNAGYNVHEAEMLHQKKVDTLKQQHEDVQQKKEAPKDIPATRNVTGPPVYYPPGHEMFAKKEEAGAWRAEGAMAKESGRYKYEAESKSKSKSSGGAAVIPVCLPLCCGLPCTIL